MVEKKDELSWLELNDDSFREFDPSLKVVVKFITLVVLSDVESEVLSVWEDCSECDAVVFVTCKTFDVSILLVVVSEDSLEVSRKLSVRLILCIGIKEDS